MDKPREQSGRNNDDLKLYAGRWVAFIRERIVGQGGTPQQALSAARLSHFKETPRIRYVPTLQPLVYLPVFERIRKVLPTDTPVHLVGGAVRDAFLGRGGHDLDFVVPKDALAIARKVAKSLEAAFYPLDEERHTGRIILTPSDNERVVVDFSNYQGPDLISDLRARDFTINAMAIDVKQPQELLDPLGGANDLQKKILQACSPDSIKADPIRILRGIRLAAQLELHITSDTREHMRHAVINLPGTSAERQRDELFKILDTPRRSKALRALEYLGGMTYVLPEITELKDVAQSPPHIYDVWNHTLEVINQLETVLEVLAPAHDPEKSANLALGLVSVRLGRYRQQIASHVEENLVMGRSMRSLLFFAALYHDMGKPATKKIDEVGRIRFFDHDKVGAGIIASRGKSLHLSNAEIVRLRHIVRYHLRPIFLTQTNKPVSRRVIYRFFRDTGLSGVDVCLLSLADVLGTYGSTLPQEIWSSHLEVVRTLLEAWWEKPQESVNPPPLVNGTELISELKITPGPDVGFLLDSIREAQAVGRVENRLQALSLARELIQSKRNNTIGEEPE